MEDHKTFIILIISAIGLAFGSLSDASAVNRNAARLIAHPTTAINQVTA